MNSFRTRSYKNGFIHCKVDDNGKTIVDVQYPNRKTVYELKSIHAAKLLITKYMKQEAPIVNPFNEHNPNGDFTRVYTSYSPAIKRHRLCFQWLMWQGSEFQIEFPDRGQAVTAFHKLKAEYNPNYKLGTLKEHTIWAEPNNDFNIDNATLTPYMVLACIGFEYSDCVRLTYTTRKTNTLMDIWPEFPKQYGSASVEEFKPLARYATT